MSLICICEYYKIVNYYHAYGGNVKFKYVFTQ